LGFELHLLYPPGVTQDIINLSVSDTRLTVSQDIQVEVTPLSGILPDGCRYRSDRLHPNSPNPFANTTVIRYELAEPGQVSIVVYDTGGRLVRLLAAMPWQGAGHHATHWDGRDESGKAVVPGVYYYSMESRNQTVTRKMVLLR
jgi:hypothetical protein